MAKGDRKFIYFSRSLDQNGGCAYIWKKNLRNLLLQNHKEHLGSKFFKIYINDDPGLTLMYFMAGSNLVPEASICEKVKKCIFGCFYAI